ncbi:hypothetical protein [Streptomyces sp. Inha503]|uniref:hypothetical protein n=1 Tax=Streptomyces sp. Inha503 TaxID=3383314 RepID=UPI0039A23093
MVTEDVCDAPGGARVAMTDQQFDEKFHSLLGPLAFESRRKEILFLVWNVERSADLLPLFTAMNLDAAEG